MTQLDALRVLAEKVEAGTEYATMGHTRMCQKAFPSDHDETREGYANAPAQLACNVWNQSSLDAAKALHEAVLPGWAGSIDTDGMACVYIPTKGAPPVKEHREFLPCPARAWLLCIIRAKIQELEQ